MKLTILREPTVLADKLFNVRLQKAELAKQEKQLLAELEAMPVGTLDAGPYRIIKTEHETSRYNTKKMAFKFSDLMQPFLELGTHYRVKVIQAAAV